MIRLATQLFDVLVISALLLNSAAETRLCAVEPEANPADAARIDAARTDANGFLVHKVESAYQAGPTEIRVLLPDRLEPGTRLSTVYVLPVEAGNGDRYGNGLLEVKRLNLHNIHNVVCVAPTFSLIPWYADHATDQSIRQESYFVKTVVPFVEGTYAVERRPADRLLVGFSKSGWGAWTLLLRHPDIFGKAAAWDTPFMTESLTRFNNGAIYGPQAHFDTYRLDRTINKQASKLRKEPRLAMHGYGGFRDDHQRMHRVLESLDIPHEYRDGPKREHVWQSGWLPDAFEFLAGAASPSGSK